MVGGRHIEAVMTPLADGDRVVYADQALPLRRTPRRLPPYLDQIAASGLVPLVVLPGAVLSHLNAAVSPFCDKLG